MLAETIGETSRLYRHIQKSKLHCMCSKTFQNKSFKHRNQRIPGEFEILFQNPGDSKSFQEGLKFPGVSRWVATLHLEKRRIWTGGSTISIAKTLATTNFSKASLKYIKLKFLLYEIISQILLS